MRETTGLGLVGGRGEGLRSGARPRAHRGQRELAIELLLLFGSQCCANLCVGLDQQSAARALKMVSHLLHAQPRILHDPKNLFALAGRQMQIMIHPGHRALPRHAQVAVAISDSADRESDEQARCYSQYNRPGVELARQGTYPARSLLRSGVPGPNKSCTDGSRGLVRASLSEAAGGVTARYAPVEAATKIITDAHIASHLRGSE